MNCPRCAVRTQEEPGFVARGRPTVLHCNAPAGMCVVPVAYGEHRHLICHACGEGFPVTPQGKEIL